MSVRTPEDFASWSARHPGRVVFAGPDPHYALGLQSLLVGYRVACWLGAPAIAEMRRRGVSCFVADEDATADKEGRPDEGTADKDGQPDDGMATDAGASPPATTNVAIDDSLNTAALLDRPEVQAFVNAQPDASLLVFKTSHRLERTCRAHGWSLLASKAALARRWENKVAFRSIGEAMGLPQPPGFVFSPAEADYADLRRRLGGVFVVQTPHGYSGARTYAVDSETTFRDILAPLVRVPLLRATTFIPGLPMTLNACVTARGVAVGAPCLQLTGLATLTRYPLGSCGNDWQAAADLSLDATPFRTLAVRVGEALARDGYRGVFGMDFVRAEDGELFLIEVNPRLVASIALYTQLELAAGRLPLLARHLLAFLDADADQAPLDQHLAPLSGAQVILHNLEDRPRPVARPMATGAYRVRPAATGSMMAPTAPPEAAGRAVSAPATREAMSGPSVDFIRPALGVDELDDDEVLILAPGTSRAVASGAAYARVQTRRRVLAPDGGLLPEIRAAVEAAEVLGNLVKAP